MAYDPNYPPTNAPLQSAAMRTQFQGLKGIVDGKPDAGDTARNPNGQMGNLDPNWSPSGDTNADLVWLKDRIVELYNGTSR